MDDVNEISGTPIFEAPEHLIGRGSELRLDRVVPETAARRLERESGKRLKIDPTVYRLDPQTLRTTSRLRAESAKLLDDLLVRTSRVRFDGQAFREGSRAMRLHLAIERSPAVRALALAIHGSNCQVCGFSFIARYGKLGTDFAEVHHLEPLGGLKAGTLVNPATDVAVLCANCHRMIHRPDPPLSPSDLAAIVASTAKTKKGRGA